MSQDDLNKSLHSSNKSYIRHFQTPYKNSNTQVGLQNSNKFISDLFSSGGVRTNINHSSNQKHFSEGRKDCVNDCKCRYTENLLKNFVYSPSSNFLFQSPSSLEKYIDSFSRERINVLKLIKPKSEIDLEGKIVYEEKSDKRDSKPVDKENSPPNRKDVAKESSVNIANGSAKSGKFLKNNKSITPHHYSFFIDNFENFEYEGLNESLFTDDHLFQPKKNLLDKFEEFENIKSEYKNGNQKQKLDKSFNSFQDLVLNSPDKEKVNFLPQCNFISNNSKRKIFLCSGNKCSDSAQKSNKSSFITESHLSPDHTFFSTQKKFRKRLRKSSDQINLLNQTYKENSHKEWTKDMITEISLQIGLPETKVYKWFWDRKNKELSEKKRFMVYSDKKSKI